MYSVIFPCLLLKHNAMLFLLTRLTLDLANFKYGNNTVNDVSIWLSIAHCLQSLTHVTVRGAIRGETGKTIVLP